jgi:uncharacterized protein (TIGR00369 family)
VTDSPIDGYPVQGTLDAALGFELLEVTEVLARARFAVTNKVLQPFGLVHGGAYAALAESLTSVATYAAVAADGNIATGQSNNSSFLRPATEGTIHAVAKVLHRGRTSWVWDVEFRDDADKLCAITRMTIAVRPPPAPPG